MGKFKKMVLARDHIAEVVRDKIVKEYADTSTYQYGLMIGMEMMQAIYQGREPKFVDTPVHLQVTPCDCEEEGYTEVDEMEDIYIYGIVLNG